LANQTWGKETERPDTPPTPPPPPPKKPPPTQKLHYGSSSNGKERFRLISTDIQTSNAAKAGWVQKPKTMQSSLKAVRKGSTRSVQRLSRKNNNARRKGFRRFFTKKKTKARRSKKKKKKERGGHERGQDRRARYSRPRCQYFDAFREGVVPAVQKRTMGKKRKVDEHFRGFSLLEPNARKRKR